MNVEFSSGAIKPRVFCCGIKAMGKVVKKKEDKAKIATPAARNDKKVGRKDRKDKRQDSSAAVGMTMGRAVRNDNGGKKARKDKRQDSSATVGMTMRRAVGMTKIKVGMTKDGGEGGCDDKNKNKKFVDKYNLGGRPKAFNSPQEMIEKMTAYFLKQEHIVIGHTKDGVSIYGQGPINIQGMCAFMGITNQTLNEYAKDKKYKAIIAQAKMICEGHLVDLCCSSKDHKADFVLKNNYKEDWKDETSTKLSGDIDVGERLKKLLGKD